MSSLPRACLIGAGSSGIAAAKALLDRGIEVDVYEKGDRVGGNWVFDNVNGMSSAYRGLHINTSRARMAYRDYPMPASYPDFPHHTQIAEYFDGYVDRFGLRKHIRFLTGVEKAERGDRGTWRITTDRGDVMHYDALLVANGHHWDPSWPDPPFPGAFSGTEIHSHFYRETAQLAGKRVVVVGMGNSAMDIAVEASEVCPKVFLSARRGVHIVPKYIFGRPLDQIFTSTKIPFRLRQTMGEALLRLAVGDLTRYGLPKPDHRVGEAHPTISGRILDRLTHGAITPKPNIARFEGRTVVFTDGSREEADVVVYCTGYKVTFPFFDPSFLAAKDNDLPLFKRVFSPDHDDLFFVGLLQPLGAIMPLAEAQGRWIASYLRGDYALPSRDQMRKTMKAERDAMFARYVASRRHTMQVDFDDYLEDLEREEKRGEARAKKRNRTLPVARLADRLGGGALSR